MLMMKEAKPTRVKEDCNDERVLRELSRRRDDREGAASDYNATAVLAVVGTVSEVNFLGSFGCKLRETDSLLCAKKEE